MKKYFIAGTDTGVGKTYVLSLMVRWLLSRGRRCFVMKPVETGCRNESGQLIPDDALQLAAAAGLQDKLGDVCPYRYETPVAPYVAAGIEGRAVNPEVVKKIFSSFTGRGTPYHCAFVEGAGGLMVPVTGDVMMIDIAPMLGLEVILVSRLGLGAVNHTLLSISELEHRHIPVAGVILNGGDGTTGVAEQTNPGTLKEFLKVPLLGVIPHGFDDAENLDSRIDAGFLLR